MIAEPFESFAQNGEDVVLWRALGSQISGRYVDVGANHPTVDSVTRAFYDRGWRGIAVEPVPAFADRFRAERPEDIVVQAAITDHSGDSVTLHEFRDTGLSTMVDKFADRHRESGRDVNNITVATLTLDDVLTNAGWSGSDIHFVSIDTEGAEEGVLAGFDLNRWRPWVLVIESTAPNTTQPTYAVWEEMVTSAGYQFCLFDGLSRFYVDRDHRELIPALSYGASVVDDYSTLHMRNVEAGLAETDARLRAAHIELNERVEEVLRWRTIALNRWLQEAGGAVTQKASVSNELRHLQNELAATHATLSWRVTRPLRMVRRRVGPLPTPR
jgi:FkbM family methyltransferase